MIHKGSLNILNRQYTNRIFQEVRECPIEEICPSARGMRKTFLKEIARFHIKTTLLRKQREQMRDQLRQLSHAVKNILGRNFEAYRFFADEVSKISQAYAVYATVRKDIIDLWTIVEDDSYETEKLVIDAELKLLSNFPDLSFDFMILSKVQQKLEEVIPSDSVQIYMRS